MKNRYRTGGLDGMATMITSLVIIVVVGIALWLLFAVSENGSYLLGWYVGFASAIICLCLLSMPSKVFVEDDRIELRGVLNTIYIPFESVKSVRTVENLRMYRLLTLGGIYGFGGYYGMFCDLRSKSRVRLFCKRRKELIEIVDLSDRVFLIGTDDNDALTETIASVVAKPETE